MAEWSWRRIISPPSRPVLPGRSSRACCLTILPRRPLPVSPAAPSCLWRCPRSTLRWVSLENSLHVKLTAKPSSDARRRVSYSPLQSPSPSALTGLQARRRALKSVKRKYFTFRLTSKRYGMLTCYHVIIFVILICKNTLISII